MDRRRSKAARFDEWTADGAGAALAFPTPPNLIEVTTERVRSGSYAAKLTVDGAPGSEHGSSVLARTGDAAADRAPTTASGTTFRAASPSAMYWVIFKFRQEDQSTMDELYDLDLINLDTGEMSLQLYDHRRQAVVPLDVASPVVPVGQWFQIEAFYRNTQDAPDGSRSGWTAARSSTSPTSRWRRRRGWNGTRAALSRT